MKANMTKEEMIEKHIKEHYFSHETIAKEGDYIEVSRVLKLMQQYADQEINKLKIIG